MPTIIYKPTRPLYKKDFKGSTTLFRVLLLCVGYLTDDNRYQYKKIIINFINIKNNLLRDIIKL